ncbi:MAG: DUF4199 domain-containing protein [Saprospiraceae bacterium]|nr:DUF4199 domain-containing protein [Saprospiraceae bacterium]MCB9324433.1 DUF4199 domain-containing protein [Lewinellaceae bacterium]
MKNTVWKYGLISGGVLAFFMILTFSIQGRGEEIDFSGGMLLGYVTMIISLSMVFVGVKSYRDNHLAGSISFDQSFKTGLLIALIASCIYVITWMLYSHFLAPDFMDQYYKYNLEQLQNSGADEEEISRQIALMEKYKEMYKNPFLKTGMTFLEIFPVGLIVALITAFILKKKTAAV